MWSRIFFQGSVFVTFKTKEDAEKFLAVESVKATPESEESLIRKWQADYFDEKQKEYEEKRKEKKEAKNKVKKAKEGAEDAASEDKASEDKDEGEMLPKGSVLVFSGLNEETMREDIKAYLETEFGVEKEAVAFVYYQKGEPEAKLRFRNEGGAKAVKDKMDEKPEDFKIEIKGATDVSCKLLEGEDEEAFLKQCMEDLKNRHKGNRGHKRKGGFNRGGGRGGKRARN